MTTSFWAYIETKLTERGLTTGDLARLTGIDRSRFTGWRNGARPSIETARAIAVAFEVSPLEVLVAAEVLSEDDVELKVVRADLSTVGDDQLLAELKRRLKGGS